MPSFFLCGFCRLLVTCCEGHAHTVAAQLVVRVRYLDAHRLISFLHSGKDGRTSPGERVEDAPPGAQIFTISRISCSGFSVTWVRFMGLA